MKKLSTLLLGLLALAAIMAGCSKDDNDDMRSLLQTVPDDAGMVAVFDLQEITKAYGCKNDGSQITLPKDIQQAIEGPGLSADDKALLRGIASGDSGVTTNALVFFSAARDYFTGFLNNPDQFVEFMKERYNTDVEEEDGARTIGRAAVIGNQFWISTTGRPDAAQLKYYQKLPEKHSYVSTEGASLLLDGDGAIGFVSDMRRAAGMMTGNETPQIRMATSMLFEDASYAAGSVKIGKKDIDLSCSILNSHFKTAKFLLPTDKIDTSVIKSMGGSGDIFFALGVSKDLVKKLTDLSKGLPGALSPEYVSALEQLQGTLAARTDAGTHDMEIKVQTTGKDFAKLSNVLQSTGFTVTRDGDTVTVVAGSDSFTGSVEADKAASMLKGAWLGTVMAGYPDSETVTIVKVVSDNGGLMLNAKIEGGAKTLIDYILK